MSMLQLGFYTTTTVHLSLEDFYNAGITPERAMQIIETFEDKATSFRSKLSCRPAGINNNWKFEVYSTNQHYVSDLLEDIAYALNLELAANGKPKKEALK